MAEYSVTWEIDGIEAETMEGAAHYVWTQIFKRHFPANEDEACCFLVTNSDGHQVYVDLS